MRRFTVFGLCLVAALAFSVLAAASAQAKRTEHGAIKFKLSGGEIVSKAAGGSVICTSSVGKGEITSGTAGTMTETLKGCAANGGAASCQNTTTGGEINSLPLDIAPGWINKTEAGVDLKGASAGEYLFEYECGGVSFKLKHSVIGGAAPTNSDNAAGVTVSLKEASGHQEVQSFEGGATDTLEAEIAGSPAGEAVVRQALLLRGQSEGGCKVHHGVEKCKPAQYELNTVAAATPQFGRCDKQKGTGKFQDANCATAVGAGQKGNFEFVEAGK
jgi:hypothetical protein